MTEVGFGHSTSNPLPDVFTSVKAHIKEGVKDAARLERYLIAYGGSTEPEYRLSETTHVIYPVGGKLIKGGVNTKHISDQWLIDSIKLKEIQDERLYKIK